MTVEANEVFVLIIGLFGIVPFIINRKYSRQITWMVVAYVILLIGLISTVVEGFYWSEFFNAVEHIGGIFLASVVFFVTVLVHKNKFMKVIEKTKELVKNI